MGADLYESYVGSILATFALSAAANYGWSGMLLPVALAVCGIVCSLIGSFLIKTKEDATKMSLLKSLRTGTYTAAALSAVLALPCPTHSRTRAALLGRLRRHPLRPHRRLRHRLLHRVLHL